MLLIHLVAQALSSRFGFKSNDNKKFISFALYFLTSFLFLENFLNSYKMKRIYATLFLLLFLVPVAFTQVHINEYSASNLNSFQDNFGKTEDWIELYNAGNTEVDISGWHLSDKISKPEKWEIPAGTVISANGFLHFFCSGRDLVNNGEYHTNFKLAQTKNGESVLLSNASGTVIESFPLELTLVEHSRARMTDGEDLWMVSTNPSLGASNNLTNQFTGYTQTPTITVAAGFYEEAQVVEIINNEPNSILHYTINGTNPTTDSPIYSGPINVEQTQVVKGRAFSNDPGILPGKMDFNTYLINEDFSLAVFSVAADSVIDLANGNGPVIPIGSLEYFNVNKEREATSFGSLNRHGQDSWVLDHRSLDWISRDEMGYSKAVNAPLFSYSDRDEYQKFMFRNSGDDNYPAINDGEHEGSTHIRDEYVQTLAQNGKMKLDLRAVERVILFLNGEYWGVYGMRERPVDHDYTDEYYDQGKYEIQYLSTWEDTEIEYGGQQAIDDWANLRDFILENDMSDSANYQIAEDSINMLSMIDYMIVNLNVVASDWLNYNTGWWRGRNPEGDHKKWGYILWDLDATFDYYLNYSGVPNISPDADPCDLEEIAVYLDDFFGGGSPPGNPDECVTIQNGSSPYPVTDSIFLATITQDEYCCSVDWDEQCQGTYDLIAANGMGEPGESTDVGKHEKIFLKLLEESPEFKELYYARYTDMMNTVFSCENMINTLDTMLAVIRPEMPRQIDRWGGSMMEWESNVEDLKDFINQRCMLLDDGALECYDELSGPYQLTLLTEPDGIGEIDLNTLDIEEFPWVGDYFGGTNNRIKAKVFNDFEDEYEFSHWISNSNNVILPSVNDRKANISLVQADTLTAVFRLIGTVASRDLADELSMRVFPNPANDYLELEFDLERTQNVVVSLENAIGQNLLSFPEAGGRKTAGAYQFQLSLTDQRIRTGLYFLTVRVDNEQRTFKVSINR